MKSFLVFAVAIGVGCGGNGQLTGAGGSGGGSQIVGVGGAGAASTGAGGATGMNCGARMTIAQPLPPDILIVLDASTSMNATPDGSCTSGCGTASRWSMAMRAVGSAVSYTDSINWGLKSLTAAADACDAGGIDIPTARFNTPQINSRLNQRTSNSGDLLDGGNSPMRGAVDVAAAYLSARPPGGHRIVLLVTDGEPDCKPGSADISASDAAGVVGAITKAASAGITTAVIGVGPTAGPAEATLTAMAQASGRAYVGGATFPDLYAAISDVAAQAADCTIAVPDPPSTDGTYNRQDIRLERTDTNATIPFDSLHMNGWDYTDASQLGIQLYGDACDRVRAGGTVAVYFLCLLKL